MYQPKTTLALVLAEEEMELRAPRRVYNEGSALHMSSLAPEPDKSFVPECASTVFSVVLKALRTNIGIFVLKSNLYDLAEKLLAPWLTDPLPSARGST